MWSYVLWICCFKYFWLDSHERYTNQLVPNSNKSQVTDLEANYFVIFPKIIISSCKLEEQILLVELAVIYR